MKKWIIGTIECLATIIAIWAAGGIINDVTKIVGPWQVAPIMIIAIIVFAWSFFSYKKEKHYKYIAYSTGAGIVTVVMLALTIFATITANASNTEITVAEDTGTTSNAKENYQVEHVKDIPNDNSACGSEYAPDTQGTTNCKGMNFEQNYDLRDVDETYYVTFCNIGKDGILRRASLKGLWHEYTCEQAREAVDMTNDIGLSTTAIFLGKQVKAKDVICLNDYKGHLRCEMEPYNSINMHKN